MAVVDGDAVTVLPISTREQLRSTIGPRTHATPGKRLQVTKQVRQLDRVIIRFAGDSGDGMQLTGDRFKSEAKRA